MGEGETLGVYPGVVLTVKERSKVKDQISWRVVSTTGQYMPFGLQQEFKGIHSDGLMHYLF